MTKLVDVLPQLETIAPVGLAEEWDNVGLLAGDPEQTVKRALLTIDLTAEVLAEAKRNRADLIIAYHPPIWEPLKKIVAGQGNSPLLHETIRSHIALYALHTALDNVRPGLNDLLADIVGIAEAQPLKPAAGDQSTMCKFVVFVPPGDLEKVSEAMFAAGAGNIGAAGKYSRCSFRTAGTGTFQCGPYSHPTIGKRGSFEQVNELRLETIVPVNKIAAVTRAMRAAHSYEEPAFDIMPLLDPPAYTGLGRFGELRKVTSVATLVRHIKKTFRVKTVGIIGPTKRRVRRAAVGAGSCGSLWREVIRQRCDVYLTGELKHHDALELQQAGVTTICLGHSHSERIILPPLALRLRRECPGVSFTVSRKDRDPFTWL